MLDVLLRNIETHGDYLTTYEVAELFDVTIMTVSRWIRKGHLPGSFKTGLGKANAWRIPKTAVVEFVEKLKSTNSG